MGYNQNTYADEHFLTIRKQINSFECDLDCDHEMVVQFAGFGAMTLTDIGYKNPDILFFYGLIGGEEVELIQHVSQLNFMLLPVKNPNPGRPPRRLGSTLFEL